MRGHVRKRGNKWAVVFYAGYNDAGKKKYKWFSGFDTKKAASDFLIEKAKEFRDHTYVEPSTQTMSDLFGMWLEFKTTQVRVTTHHNYQRLLTTYMLPYIGHVTLDKLNVRHLQSTYSKLVTERGIKGSVVRVVHGLIHNMLAQAQKWDMLAKNVAEIATPPRTEHREMVTWTSEQVQEFLNLAASSPYLPIYIVAIATGMRRGEVMGLKWLDVDLERATLTIVRTLSYLERKPVITDAKRASSRRTVVLPSFAVDVLRQHRTHQIEMKLKMGNTYRDEGWVFAKYDGSTLQPETVRDAFERLIKKSNLPYIRFHDLRHTHATLMLQQGIHPKVVSERLGHSNISITLGTYSHVMPGMQEQAASKFNGEVFSEVKISNGFADAHSPRGRLLIQKGKSSI